MRAMRVDVRVDSLWDVGSIPTASIRNLHRGRLDATRPGYSVDEMAAHLGHRPRDRHRWIEQKGLPVHRIGKFKVSEVDEAHRPECTELVSQRPSGINHANVVYRLVPPVLKNSFLPNISG